MIKFTKIKFLNHPILNNLELNFCDQEGKPVDTIIFAGENGTGKSTILESLYKLVSGNDDFNADVEIVVDGGNIISLPIRSMGALRSSLATRGYKTCGIFSDVDINFKSQAISQVTSMQLDSEAGSRRSNSGLPNRIKQLLIDIQAQDDSALSAKYREEKANGRSTDQMEVDEKMPRFTRAFNQMFENLTYSSVENLNNSKAVIFKKFGRKVTIDQLSSGEKQIVYRGCFLLKDKDALRGATVFIDEPEISLHPSWQEKILNYYKNIFTNDDGVQTSQIFVVTHSPFIIHNSNRKNDKVIILSRDDRGDIVILDKPSYYKCDSVEVVKDAFNVNIFEHSHEDESIVFLEGRTDEKYFNKAIEVYGLTGLPFKFKWVGFLDENGKEINTGKDALNQACNFLVSRKLDFKNVLLYDCDTNKSNEDFYNVFVRTITRRENNRFKRGVENALVLPSNFDYLPFYSVKEKIGDYGETKNNSEFKKMEFCNHICALPIEELKNIFVNLKEEIEKLVKLFNEQGN